MKFRRFLSGLTWPARHGAGELKQGPAGGPLRSGQRAGIALLMVLLVTGLLSALCLSFMRLSRLEALVADNTQAQAQAEIMAQAGLRAGMALLAQDDQDYDALTDGWAHFERYAAMTGAIFLEGGFTGKIEDLSGRLNLNGLIDRKTGTVVSKNLEQFQVLLELIEAEPSLADALLDWLDQDDETRPYGAEEFYYSSLEPAYSCSNGLLDTVGQLRLIKGFTPEILNGADGRPGLLSLVAANTDTVRQVNINTADVLILKSLAGGLTETLVQSIIEYRSFNTFERIEDLKNVSGMTDELFNQVLGLISVKSSSFIIRVEGRYRQARYTITGIVDRDSNGVELLYYKSG